MGGSASLKKERSLFSRCRNEASFRLFFALALFTGQKLEAQFLINVARINYCLTGSKFFTSARFFSKCNFQFSLFLRYEKLRYESDTKIEITE